MKFNLITKFALVACLVIGLAAISVPRGEAAEATVTSTVEVSAIEVTVTGVQAVAFGLLAPPVGVADFWIINSCDPGALTGPAGRDIFPLDHSRGEFIIVGQPSFVVEYSVAVLNQFASTFLTLILTGADLCPTSPRNLGVSGQINPEVGGTLQVNPGIPGGIYNDALIQMTADYN